MPHSHFLLSAKARTLSMREVFAMSDDQAFEAFRVTSQKLRAASIIIPPSRSRGVRSLGFQP